MRHAPNPHIERYRVTTGPLASDASYGNNGAFLIPSPLAHTQFFVICSDGKGWEHVSVTLEPDVRIPSWAEMAYVKSLFWDDEETVVQYHPARPAYVNYHPHCLHLFRPTGAALPTPPAWMVGPLSVRKEQA